MFKYNQCWHPALTQKMAAMLVTLCVTVACSVQTPDASHQREGIPSTKPNKPVGRAQAASDFPGVGDLRRCIFIILDASDACHFSYIGYDRDTSPNIDALGEQGVRFMAAHSQTVNTLSSARTYLTGQYLPAPVVENKIDFGYSVPENARTLASAFAARGYQTLALSQNPFVSEEFNFAIGFDYFHRYRGRSPMQIPDGREFDDPTAGILEEAKVWIRETREEASFCYLHLLRPHNHFDSPEPYVSRWNERGYPLTKMLKKSGKPYPLEVLLYLAGTVRGDISDEDVQFLMNLYDGNIAYADALVGDFIGWLKKEGIFDDTLVIIASDHGEAFMQHGYLGHNKTVYEDMTHVPLVFSSPQGARFVSGSIAAPVEMIDVFPTLAELFDLPVEAPLHGRSLLPLLRGESRKHKPFLYAQTNDLLNFSVSTANHKVIFKRSNLDVPFEAAEIYDLSIDHAEKHDLLLSPKMATIRARAEQALLAYSKKYWSGAQASSAVVSEGTIEELKSLGYLGEDQE